MNVVLSVQEVRKRFVVKRLDKSLGYKLGSCAVVKRMSLTAIKVEAIICAARRD